MLHKIKAVNALPNYRLLVQFADGITKMYDVTPLFKKWPVFRALENNPELFSAVEVDVGGHGIVWNDELDLSCDELYENGETVLRGNPSSVTEITRKGALNAFASLRAQAAVTGVNKLTPDDINDEISRVRGEADEQRS